MSMPIKACGGAEYFRGACRDRYLGRRDCADCEPLTPPAVEGDGRTVSVDLTSGDASPSDAQQPADPPADPTSGDASPSDAQQPADPPADPTSGDASPSDAQQPADPPADPTPAASTAKPRAPRGAPKRP